MSQSAREKDRLWKFYKEAKEFTKEHYCTKNELWNPTERNVQKCMREIQMTRNIGEPLKRAAAILGEPSNIEKFRRTGHGKS